MFQKLSEKYVNHRNFVRYYSLREDLIATGVLACVKSFPKFRPMRGDDEWNGEEVEYHYTTCNNPFAFFTTCIHNDFVHLLKKEYNQSNIINEVKLAEGLEADYGYEEMIRNREEAKSGSEKQ